MDYFEDHDGDYWAVHADDAFDPVNQDVWCNGTTLSVTSYDPFVSEGVTVKCNLVYTNLSLCNSVYVNLALCNPVYVDLALCNLVYVNLSLCNAPGVRLDAQACLSLQCTKGQRTCYVPAEDRTCLVKEET